MSQYAFLDPETGKRSQPGEVRDPLEKTLVELKGEPQSKEAVLRCLIRLFRMGSSILEMQSSWQKQNKVDPKYLDHHLRVKSPSYDDHDQIIFKKYLSGDYVFFAEG